MRAIFVLAVLFISTCTCVSFSTLQERIRHIIVLMEENRSFDHLLGWLAGVDGLTGAEYNLVNSRDKTSRRMYVTRNASSVVPCDPDHSTPATTMKMFGWDAPTNPGNATTPGMGNFFDYERTVHGHTHGCRALDMYDPARLPVLTTLAQNFVLFDRFFASHPGPTWPNRLYAMCGTSGGLTESGPWYRNTKGRLFPQPTLMDQIAQGGGAWKLYYNDTPWELFIESVAHHPENLRPLKELFDDARRGTLPDFAFINPRVGVNVTLGVGSSDHHPDHDINLGEEYYKSIYEALRASPQWNETLFIITYDEHGGYFDHVPPPGGVPPPDKEPSYPDEGIIFDRLGMRIPTLLISPWVPAGVVLGAPPPSQRPAPNSEYELTSIAETIRKILPSLKNSTPLTKRSAWAATFEDVLMRLGEPRTDCPTHLPNALPPSRSFEVEAQLAVNALQRDILEIHSGIHGSHSKSHSRIQRQAQVGPWLQRQFELHAIKTASWKRSKSSSEYALEVLHMKDTAALSQTWTLNNGSSYVTVSSRMSGPHELCLDALEIIEGARVGVTVCYPSAHPATNRDVSQHWQWHNDSTLRPARNDSLCLTNHFFDGDTAAYLQPCTSQVEQRWAYMGPVVGSNDLGFIYFGDFITSLSVVLS